MTIHYDESTALSTPAARNELTTVEFDAMMKRGLKEAKTDDSRPAAEVFEALRGRSCE